MYDLIKQAPKGKKHVKVIWRAQQEQTFVQLKALLKSTPVLAQPDLRKPYVIETDASDFAYGAVLL